MASPQVSSCTGCLVPPSPTHAQTLPCAPGSLNLPLVSQPPTLTKCLRTLLWSTRTRGDFSMAHTGLGLSWLKYYADFCQMLAAMGQRGKGKTPLVHPVKPRKALLYPHKRSGPSSDCCPPASAVRLTRNLFSVTRRIFPKTREVLPGLNPTLHSLQSHKAPSHWLETQQLCCPKSTWVQ